jgi:hypothetical protein
MKAASLKVLKQELSNCSQNELFDLCLRLTKFKKENKELLSYLLFESANEMTFIKGVKTEMDQQFETINISSYFYIKKSVRKILAGIKKNIRYSQKKETEVELMLYFCFKLKDFSPSIRHNVTLQNIYLRQIEQVKRAMGYLHEDLQHDYKMELEELGQ